MSKGFELVTIHELNNIQRVGMYKDFIDNSEGIMIFRKGKNE